MKHIILYLDDRVFYRLKQDKLRRCRRTGIKLTWERYFEVTQELLKESEVRASK